MNPRGGPGTASQVNDGLGETPGRVVRLKERTSGFRAKRRRKLMKKWNVVASLVLGVGLAALPAVAQDAAKKTEPPKAALSPTQSVLEQWNDIGRKLIAMAWGEPLSWHSFFGHSFRFRDIVLASPSGRRGLGKGTAFESPSPAVL